MLQKILRCSAPGSSLVFQILDKYIELVHIFGLTSGKFFKSFYNIGKCID